jgi:5-(hydroxymethyl)furfural/furfural oxidase
MPVPTSIDENDRRVSCAMAYLTPAVRARKNLTIRTETLVRRVLFEGTRAFGAEIARGDKTEVVRGREIVLTCGAIHSPAILMRSGIGAPDELARHGIEVVAALAGVGRNLIEHPSVSVSCYLHHDGRLHNLERHHTQAQVRFSSRLPGIPAGDMCLAVLARSGWHALGRRVGSLYFFVNKAYSQGFVALRSADPRDPPEINFHYFHEGTDKSGQDLAACVEGIRLARSINAQLGNIIEAELFPGPNYPGDAGAAEWAKNEAWGHHASCSNQIGKKNDGGVVDGNFLVYGTKNLRVVDASVFPNIPGYYPMIPLLMISEKASDVILAAAAH